MADHKLVVPVYPRQRVLRAVVLDVIVWGPVVLALVPQVVAASHVLVDGGVITPAVYGELVALGTAATAIRAALTRVISLPGVDAILTRFGLGTVPRAAFAAADVQKVRTTSQALAAISRTEGGTP